MLVAVLWPCRSFPIIFYLRLQNFRTNINFFVKTVSANKGKLCITAVKEILLTAATNVAPKQVGQTFALCKRKVAIKNSYVLTMKEEGESKLLPRGFCLFDSEAEQIAL